MLLVLFPFMLIDSARMCKENNSGVGRYIKVYHDEIWVGGADTPIKRFSESVFLDYRDRRLELDVCRFLRAKERKRSSADSEN
jgi:hypothetical protein